MPKRVPAALRTPKTEKTTIKPIKALVISVRASSSFLVSARELIRW